VKQFIAGDLMLVPLRQKTLEVLLGLRAVPGESFDDVIGRLARSQQNSCKSVAESRLSDSRTNLGEPYAFSLFGERQGAHTARDLLVAVLRVLNELDANLLPELSRYQARKRRYVARLPERLYPGRPDLARYSAKVTEGWWVGTNYSQRGVERILRLACSVCGLDYGKDLVIVFKTTHL